MNKAAVYVATAIILGLVTTLLPTCLFLVNADQQEKLAEAFARSLSGKDFRLPLLDYSEQNHVGAISAREVEILSISFVVASIVYILFKRKTPKRVHIWPSVRPY